MLCTFWNENFWRCSSIELFPSSGSQKHFLIFHVNLIGRRSFLGIKHGISVCIPSISYCNLKPEAMHALFFPKIYHFPYFKILQTNPVIISKLVHKNSKQPTLSECTQIQPFYGLVCQTIFVKTNKTKRLHTCVSNHLR